MNVRSIVSISISKEYHQEQDQDGDKDRFHCSFMLHWQGV